MYRVAHLRFREFWETGVWFFSSNTVYSSWFSWNRRLVFQLNFPSRYWSLTLFKGKGLVRMLTLNTELCWSYFLFSCFQRIADNLKAIIWMTTSCLDCLMILDKCGPGFPVIFLLFFWDCVTFLYEQLYTWTEKTKQGSECKLPLLLCQMRRSLHMCEQFLVLWPLESCNEEREFWALRGAFSELNSLCSHQS